ncbi:hypothetical protein [Azonexus sp.]|uniref:hypothetical protein n=1 Tax=Azonexus sp. TaxID=1872668 RepID=UPI0027BA2815|nr:hypothetical protein [Azonexus sp.]
MTRTVFWSWQSDLQTAVTKDFIKTALKQALKKVATELQLESADRIELDHDTKGEAGLVEIVTTIFNKIDECEVFVADITPVATISSTTGEKKIPNPNVMIELGYALRELGHQRVITVANLAFGGRPEELPFDLRHRRGAITYSLASNEDPSLEKERTTLVNQLAAALKLNLEAPREDKKFKNLRPVLTLEASDEMPAVSLVQQNASLEGVPTLADIETQTPVRSNADQTKAGSTFDFSLHIFDPIGVASRARIKPFREWTQEELDGYNERVQYYYEQYATYIKAVKEHRLLLQRAIIVKLVAVNRGTLPANDVRSHLSFPSGVLVYENDDLPKPPAPPTPPPFAPYGVSHMGIVQAVHRSFANILTGTPRIADDRSSIVFETQKLQHGYQKAFPSFTLLLSSQHDIKGFEADYYITTDELPTQVTGKLHFEVEISGS